MAGCGRGELRRMEGIDYDLSAGILEAKAEASSVYYTEGSSVLQPSLESGGNVGR